MYGSGLQGTMTENDVLTMAEAFAAEQQKQLAARSAQTAAAEQQAQNNYTGAAAAPIPQPTPWQQALPLIAGNISSLLLGGDQAPMERGRQEVQRTRGELLKQRADNLQALQDVWMHKADLARRAGDTEAELKARTQWEKIHEIGSMVRARLDREGALEREKLQQKGANQRAAQDRGDEGLRQKINATSQIAQMYIQAGLGVPQDVQKQLVEYGVLPKGTNVGVPYVNALPGGRKPYAGEVVKPPDGVAMVNINQYMQRREGIFGGLNSKKANKAAVVANGKAFELNTRVRGETARQWKARMESIEDPTRKGKRLYSDKEINDAGSRLFTSEEQDESNPE